MSSLSNPRNCGAIHSPSTRCRKRILSTSLWRSILPSQTLCAAVSIAVLPELFSPLLPGQLGAAWAACDNTPSLAQATGGSNCGPYYRSQYSGTRPVRASGNGSRLVLAANSVVIIGTGSVNDFASVAQGGGMLIFRGGADIRANAVQGDGIRIINNGSVQALDHVRIIVRERDAVGVLSRYLDFGSSMGEFTSLDIITQGTRSRGMVAFGDRNNTIVATDQVNVVTLGDQSDGIEAARGGKIFVTPGGGTGSADGNTFLVFDIAGSSVETSGDGSHGLFANANAGDSTIEMGMGEIVTGADGNSANAKGIHALVNGGTGGANVTLFGGSVTTNGQDSDAVMALVDNNATTVINGSATIVMAGGTISANGDGSAGLVAQTDQSAAGSALGNATVTQRGGSIATTGGSGGTLQNASGILAIAAGQGTASVTQSGGAITTQGAEAHGIEAVSNAGSASVVQDEPSSITVTGANSDGIRVMTGTAGRAISVAGKVAGGGGSAAGIHTIGVAGSTGTIDVAATAKISALSGIAILDEDGDVAITSFGEIAGDVEPEPATTAFS